MSVTPAQAMPHLKTTRIARQRHQRRVSAVTRPGNTHALGIGETLGDGPLHGIDHVVLHRQSPLPPARLEVLETIAGTAAEFRLENEVTTTGKQLRLAIPLPTSAANPRPPMQQNHRRQVGLACSSGWQRDVQRHIESIARLDAHEVRAAHELRVNAGTRARNAGQRARLCVVDRVHGRLRIGKRRNQHRGSRGTQRHCDSVHRAGHCGIDQLLNLLQAWVEPDRAGTVSVDMHADQSITAALPDRDTVKVEAVYRNDGLRVDAPGDRVIHVKRTSIPPVVRADEDRAIAPNTHGDEAVSTQRRKLGQDAPLVSLGGPDNAQ